MCVTELIRSMTGYGRFQDTVDQYDISVEIKSVNHRYFEFYCRAPRVYGYLEDKLKQYIHKSVFRGKVEVYINITPLETGDTSVNINHFLAGSYLEELRNMGTELGLKDDIAISHLSRFSDIFVLRRLTEDEDQMWSRVETITGRALAEFIQMRTLEGYKLKEDILSRLDLLEGFTREIEQRTPAVVDSWRERLYNKLSEVLDNKQIDEARLITEAAIFAEKIAVDEETVRLHSHFSQFRQIMDEPDSIGRKLDFLTQEINRETNTIGSKSQDTETSKIIVEMKSETEKIREQIQNLE